ncbi:hypothetical protein [Salinibacter altiplanensis]|uniref:hypothetical protein n=1 Tax=Salinibacter altiplanensis TaxID=1803181 RepID=UPI000C9F21E7|nr:hypothetical protein [Salinibacter altiplanensis]
MTDFDPEDLRDQAGGDGAARVPLSEAIEAIRSMLDDCDGTLAATQLQLQKQELPEIIDIDEAELERPAVQVRKVAEKLETCATALRNASGQTGDSDSPNA